MIRIIGTAIVLILVFLPVTVNAAVPRLMSFQGKLTNNADQALTGNYNFTFRIYGAATGGTAMWTEVQNGVAVETGIYNVLLGSATALNLAFDTGYWLSVEVNGDGEMSPRYRLTSAPYSLFSDTATNVVSGGSGGGLQRIVLTGTFDTSAVGDFILYNTPDSMGVYRNEIHYKVVSDSRISFADMANTAVCNEKPWFSSYMYSDTNQNVFYNYAPSFSSNGAFYLAEGVIYLPFKTRTSTPYTGWQWTTTYSIVDGSKYWIVIIK